MPDLDTILAQIWTDLQGGAADSHDAFHTPVLGTLDAHGESSLRTVVLRGTEPQNRAIFCHTDVRATKVEEIRQHGAVSWMFYAPERKIQIRAQTSAQIHHGDALALQHWQQTTLSSRRAYLANAAPGSELAEPGSGLPSQLTSRSPDQAESEAGWPNFAVIVSSIELLDWLYLDSKGHRRAQFNWTGDKFEGKWVIP